MKKTRLFFFISIFLIALTYFFVLSYDISQAGSPCGNAGPYCESWGSCTPSCGNRTQSRECGTTVCGLNCWDENQGIWYMCCSDQNIYYETQACSYIACPPSCTASCGAWGSCSKTCGGGTQSRNCTRADCTTYSESQACNTQACPPTCTPSCGAWSACSAIACGTSGTQTQTCTNASCGNYTNTQNCNAPACSYTYSWATGSWSSCGGGTCGGSGTQTRSVWCRRSDGVAVADSYCSGTKPATTQSCTMPACTYSWRTGSWGACSVSCGGGTQTRSVWCQRSDGITVSDSFCALTKPTGSQSCNTQACPTYSCQGVIPANAILCTGDDTGLISNTARTLVSSCTSGTKCEYTCNTNYILSDGACKLPPPSNPAASCPAPGFSGALSWSAVSGASAYLVRVDDNPDSWGGCTGSDICVQVAGTSYSFVSDPGKTYNWWVHAVDLAGNYSDAVGSGWFTCGTNYTLDVNTIGTGNGTISGPGGINCHNGGGTCNVSFSPGTAVSLTNTPDANSNFINWTNDCSGSSCNLTMNSNKTVKAQFDLKTCSPDCGDQSIRCTTETWSDGCSGTCTGTKNCNKPWIEVIP